MARLAKRFAAPSLQHSASLQHWFYASDAGGNVTALLSTNQSVVGRYLYDPYGNVLAKHGLLGDANLYRYSSKEAHERSGLVYFGLRYYSPTLQRWLNEDPAGEAGGVNLFVFAGNSSLSRLDPWGLWPIINIPIIIKPKDKVWVDPCAGRPGGSCFSGWYVAYDWRWARSGTNSASGPKDSDKNEPRTYTTATDKLGAAVPVAGHLAGLVIDLIEAAGRFLASLGGLPTDLAWEIGRGLSSTGIPGLKQIGEYGLGTGIKHGGLLGKVWNAPNTAIGLVYGAILSGAGEVKFGNNGLQFLESQLNTMVKGDVALGNTITYSAKMGPDVKNKDVAPLGYGLHEGQHTYQGQNIGPAYLPAYVLGAVGALGRGHMYWDHFMEQGPISTTPVPWNH